MLRAFFGAVITLAICAPMFAHHGASAFDRGATVTLKATITEKRAPTAPPSEYRRDSLGIRQNRNKKTSDEA